MVHKHTYTLPVIFNERSVEPEIERTVFITFRKSLDIKHKYNLQYTMQNTPPKKQYTLLTQVKECKPPLPMGKITIS